MAEDTKSAVAINNKEDDDNLVSPDQEAGFVSWGRRARELTRDEAIAQARLELAPYWFGAEPMLVGLEDGSEIHAFPLEGNFTRETWLVLLADSTTFWGSSIIECVRAWEERYRLVGLNILVVYHALYQFQRNPTAAQKWMEEEVISCVRCFDVNSALIQALRGTVMPKALLYKDAQLYLEVSGEEWISKTDLKIQQVLRMMDPGLPFPPVMSQIQNLVYDCERIDFGSRAVESGRAVFTGRWEQNEEKVWTQDPDATVVFRVTGSELAILAQPSREDASAAIAVELCGLAPYELVRGKHLRISENAELVVQLIGPKLYWVLTGLPAHEREVTLRFRNLTVSGVELYGIRFGNRMKFAD
jgi:hypothetical protein